MARVRLCILVAVSAITLPAVMGAPIFWFLPWNTWIPTTSSGSASSSSTSRSPINASIAIGNRDNTTAALGSDSGTIINGLVIQRGRRSLPSSRQERSPQQANESVIQIGSHVIRLPNVLSNVSINIIDGVPYVERITGAPPVTTPGLLGHIKNIFDGFFNRTS